MNSMMVFCFVLKYGVCADDKPVEKPKQTVTVTAPKQGANEKKVVRK